MPNPITQPNSSTDSPSKPKFRDCLVGLPSPQRCRLAPWRLNPGALPRSPGFTSLTINLK